MFGRHTIHWCDNPERRLKENNFTWPIPFRLRSKCLTGLDQKKALIRKVLEALRELLTRKSDTKNKKHLDEVVTDF